MEAESETLRRHSDRTAADVMAVDAGGVAAIVDRTHQPEHAIVSQHILSCDAA